MADVKKQFELWLEKTKDNPEINAELRRINHELDKLTDMALKLHYDLQRALKNQPNDLRTPRPVLGLKHLDS